ncbi:MAG TPA: AI-2E family transporter, partial [Ramlibacter sp.]|nr:AI-2E family transporter [Ramlibacter sp.]
VFIALEPSVYQRGIVRLVPVVHRPRLSAALEAAAAALGGWLRGQALSMLFVGVATWVGLALLDVPLALILGVLAGILGFIPFFGAIVSGALAVLLEGETAPPEDAEAART